MKSSCNHHDSENLQLEKKQIIRSKEKTQNEQPVIQKWPSAQVKNKK